MSARDRQNRDGPLVPTEAVRWFVLIQAGLIGPLAVRYCIAHSLPTEASVLIGGLSLFNIWAAIQIPTAK